eukprot:CAMPEP_0184367320 /NCGR_PEP_ID=MMETSP1089-20130417/157858_1 /TAXON_ID=38269 ORGANISM="Gloeochaete wittrockiana, Strain SAG46.84" /NCGR_SAMPLE_ID=MMETSP1089 /ASSEMBLY_ACC=CAM_ASM_000445 /LENGTH=45 /DNA_ID= /DNA_START= /DNA_END= /DNA_ORIENTATION=
MDANEGTLVCCIPLTAAGDGEKEGEGEGEKAGRDDGMLGNETLVN